jgi:hypothetical protein
MRYPNRAAMVVAAATMCTLPVAAQTLTPAELEGLVLSGAVNYTGTFRRAGFTYDADIVRRFSVKIGAQGSINTSVVREVHYQGTVTKLNRSFSGKIGVPGQTEDSKVLWILEGNTLTGLNVFDVGGRSTKFTIKRAGAGFSCSVVAPFMQEMGAGNTKTSAAKGGKAEILKIRQTGSSCAAKK